MSVVESVTSVGPDQLEDCLPKSVQEKELMKENLTEQADLIQKDDKDCDERTQAAIGEQLEGEIDQNSLEVQEHKEIPAKQLEELESQTKNVNINEKFLEEQQSEGDVSQKEEEIDQITLEEQQKIEEQNIEYGSENQSNESLEMAPGEEIDQNSSEEQQNEEERLNQAKDCIHNRTEEKEERVEKTEEISLEIKDDQSALHSDEQLEKLEESSELEIISIEEQQKKQEQEVTPNELDEQVEILAEQVEEQDNQVRPEEENKQLDVTESVKREEEKEEKEEEEEEEEEEKEEEEEEKVEEEKVEENKEEEEQQAEDSSQVADLPNATVRQTLRQLIQNLWPDLNSTDFELERASAKGDNYLGVVWRICVKSEGSLVVKLPPQNSVRRKQFFARPCFLRESLAYEQFLPLVAEFQMERNIPVEEQFTQYARCQACRLDEPNECIVLEDLCRSGYDLHDRFAELPPECVRLVMRAYAKLHATSLALKQQCPDRLEHCRNIVDIFEQRRDDHALGVYFENLKQSALGSLRPEDDHQYVERLEAYFASGTFFELLLPLISGSNCEPYAVICHGDCWNNNIMYKLCEKEDHRPIDVRLIDWQLMRYASPITDLAYFFFSCTSREFRKNHYKSMLETYYTEMEQQLIRLGESVDQLFPLNAFNEQLQTKSAVGLLLAMMVLPIVTMRGQDVPDLEAISVLIESGGTTSLKGAGFLGSGNEDLYKERMRDVILDCVDNNYI